MGDSNNEIRLKFDRIMNNAGYRPEVASTLDTFLLAAPGQHAPSQGDVTYVIGRLWVEDPEKGSVT